MTDQMVGNLMKLQRKKKGLTLQAVSESTGLSVSYLSMLERGLSSPTVANLNTICKALGITMAELILKLDAPKILVRESERPVIISAPGFSYEAATEGDHQMSCVVMKTRDDAPHNASMHIADEIGYIVKGSLEMTIDGEKYIVNEGDCVYIDANTLHDYRRISDEECLSVWVYASAAAMPDSTWPKS